MAKITDPDNLIDFSTRALLYANVTGGVFIDVTGKTIQLHTGTVLNNVGVQNENGVTLKALYSFLKEEWRLDPNSKNLAAFPFPMVPITDEQFEFVDGWDHLNDTGRYLIRDAGWTVKNITGGTTQQWAGIIGLGTIQTDDQLYYQQQFVSGGATNVQLFGQVNQAVQTFRDTDGDGNPDFDYRGFFALFGREFAQTYGKATLTDIGVTSLASQAYRFPISTADDSLKVSETDALVATGETFTGIYIRFMSGAYGRDIDLTNTPRNFGIVVDVGTFSTINGRTNATNQLVAYNVDNTQLSVNHFQSGTVTLHTGADKGAHTVTGVTLNGSNLEVYVSPALTASSDMVPFTLAKTTSFQVAATAEQIYTKVQYLLRQSVDVDGTINLVTGKTADQLMYFVGDSLVAGRAPSQQQPFNPNFTNGSGVVIEGFSANDTNRISFYDNTNTSRTFPFVATLTLNFGDNLVNDANARYWVYFTTLPGTGDDYGETGAFIVNDNDGLGMSGAVSAQSSVSRTFDYDNNTQGSAANPRTAGTDASVTAVAIGLSAGQYVKAAGTIERSTTNSISLVAALERNYENP